MLCQRGGTDRKIKARLCYYDHRRGELVAAGSTEEQAGKTAYAETVDMRTAKLLKWYDAYRKGTRPC
jgi:hypothetical protein